MNFQLGDKIYLIVTKFDGFPQLQVRNCFVNKGKIVPTRMGINLILPQYAKLKNACEELLMHTDSDQPLEKDLGFNLSARNKLCNFNGETVRKVVWLNDRTSGLFDIGS